MMNGPDVNPLTAKLMGGADFRAKLREQLLAQAQETDDPAYAGRLREAAEGKRPLRTLLHDPAFMAAHGMTRAAEEAAEARLADQQPTGTPEEVREAWRAQLASLGVPIPTLDEAGTLTDDVLAIQRRAAAVLAEDRATQWGGSVDRLAEAAKRTDGQAGAGQ
jgi:hypothetical protein